MSATRIGLPQLREELNLFAGPPAADGSPTWHLHDPVRNLFFNIDWLSFEILSRWGMTEIDDIINSIAENTPLTIDIDDINEIINFLLQNQLCRIDEPKDTTRLVEQHHAQNGSIWHWLMHHYLFFRIPLIRPDYWLSKQLSWVAFFYSKRFFQITLIALLVGFIQCYRQWSQFVTTFVDTMSVSGILYYAIALVIVKTLHELGHAFTAKRKGCRVPTMGIAFLVMWPVAYTDVNESWKLQNKHDRLAIGAAGMVTELMIAAWAMFAWAILPDDNLKQIAFFLATTSIISTLLINISPVMRFDGYFILSDYLNIPNLHARSFALARWDLRERLFNLNETVPEVFSIARHRGLILFAWLVWLYRFILFVGIALLVYHFFFKLLGIFLFIIEIGFFVMRPIWHEMKQWYHRFPIIKQSRRSKISILVLLSFILLASIPWYTPVNSQGMLRTTEYFPIYPPGPAQISELNYEAGTHIEKGALIFNLDSPTLNSQIKRTEKQIENLNWQLAFSGMDETLRARQSIAKEELAALQAEQLGYLNERKRYEISAPFSGVLVDPATDLKVGMWVNRQDRLGLVINPNRWQVEAYLSENDIHRVKVGDSAKFFPETLGSKSLTLKIIRVDRDATTVLTEPMLTISEGGQWPVQNRKGQLIPNQAIYRIVLEVNNEAKPYVSHAMRGKIIIQGEGKSLIGDYLRSALAVLIRESGW